MSEATMISAKDVKKLRDMTGAGMMDCKKALTETEGDVDKALELLRKKGAATLVQSEENKEVVTSLREIAAGFVQPDYPEED